MYHAQSVPEPPRNSSLRDASLSPDISSSHHECSAKSHSIDAEHSRHTPDGSHRALLSQSPPSRFSLIQAWIKYALNFQLFGVSSKHSCQCGAFSTHSVLIAQAF
jgi:hypothetical protein